MRTIAIIAAALLCAAPALAQKGGGFHASTPSFSAARTYSAPTISRPSTPTVSVSRPASQPSFRAASPASRTAPIARTPGVAATAGRARGPAIKAMAPRATLRAPTPQAKGRAAAQQPHQPARPVARPVRTSYAYGGSTWLWTPPYASPLWWMATMHRPYTYAAYDDFIRRCLRTPRDRRSRECIRALRERGIRG